MSPTVKRRMLSIYHWVYKIVMSYSILSLFAVIVIVSAQVVARNIFRSNIRWNQEVALLLTIWTAFLGISIGVDKGLHIQIEMFFSHFPKRMQRVVDRINQILLLLVGVFFTVYGIVLILFTTNSKLTVTRWPACLMYIMIPVSGLCICYFVLLKLLGIRTQDEDKTGEGIEE